MAKISSGLSLSSNYFMRNFYANNRNVIKSSGRNDYTKIELSFEDSRALTRASKRLLNNDYASETDEKDEDVIKYLLTKQRVDEKRLEKISTIMNCEEYKWI